GIRPSPGRRHETRDPPRPDALKCQFHGVARPEALGSAGPEGYGRQRRRGERGAGVATYLGERPATQSSRARVISSPLRATKFHHISKGSPNGTPPITKNRASLRPPAGDRLISDRPAGRCASNPGAMSAPPTTAEPSTATTPYSKSSRTGSTKSSPPGTATSYPASGLNTSAGDRSPRYSPMATVTLAAPSRTTGRSAWWAKRGS